MVDDRRPCVPVLGVRVRRLQTKLSLFVACGFAIDEYDTRNGAVLSRVNIPASFGSIVKMEVSVTGDGAEYLLLLTSTKYVWMGYCCAIPCCVLARPLLTPLPRLCVHSGSEIFAVVSCTRGTWSTAASWRRTNWRETPPSLPSSLLR